ncbi:MAG: NAD-glutamate dehydrogenase [Alphaproteobacteria bacterium]|nr:NAD-glutamate dehydrogenase [Alphaproteobacteria bacterium]
MNTLLVSAGYLPLSSALSRLQQTDADLASFVVQFFQHASPQDLEAYPPDLLITLARHAWQASAERKPGGRILIVRAAPEAAHGQDILLAVNDDMPFLFDSLMNELNAQGAGIRAAFHPIIAIRRDASGKRTGVGGEGARRESFICVLMDSVGVSREQDVLNGVEQVLADVSAAVRDWRTMLGRMEESARELKKHPPAGLGADDLAESDAFLSWLLDNHFTFLGCRDYVFEAKGEGGLKPLAESGLGLLSDPERRVIRQGSDRTALTPEVREFLMQPQPIIITKGAVRSSVHRRVHLDYIGVKRFGPDGALAGERRFVGLFTSAAYHRNPSDIPLLRRKVESVVARSGLPPQSHSGKALANVLDTYPRDELFQVSEDELHDIAMGILHITERPQTRVFLRFDKFDRTISALLFMPRERFSAEAVDKASHIIADAFNGHVAASYPQFGDAPVARAYVIIARHAGQRPEVDQSALQEKIAASLRSWNDSLGAALASSHLPAARSLARRYGEAFEAAYRDEVEAGEAVRDVEIIEGLRQSGAGPGSIAIALAQGAGSPSQALHAKLFVASAQAELSTALPVFENFGLRAIEERPYRVTPRDAGGFFSMIHDYRLALSTPQPIDLAAVKARFEEAFKAVWTGEVENDSFNRLVLQAALSVREVSALRAIAKFLRQAGLTYSQAYMEDALARNPDVAGLVLRLFKARFDPGLGLEARMQETETISERINAALLDVKSLDEDRILRRFVNAVSAMLRTTYYQTSEHGVPHPVIAFKFDSHLLDDLPAPRPLYEIFVYHPRVEGVHLRFGRVARGGLRWSDRREDFRTEVLSLVKAQQVKNAVIVPVGAKGGFFPKQLPLGGTREEFQAEGIAAYKMFVSTLLDLTDNLVAGEIVPPALTVRHDGDDPYLVVAADKGTATFSDTANGIATARGFWLGDAFASGGSKGYDHKKMGITARGAWEAVKRHFREMGHDTQSEPFSVIGVGDMSGDVFGNGMLLSDKIRLIAAFDHRDIFLDPDPDMAVSFRERQRLFALPRSSWADYDRALISPGGGVY